jgi:hypothetical protein
MPRKVHHHVNKDSFLLENNYKREGFSLTTTFKKNQPYIWLLDGKGGIIDIDILKII